MTTDRHLSRKGTIAETDRHRSRYEGLLAEAYDVEQAWLDDVNFYAALAAKQGGKVLELGCGTGRVLIPLAEKGFRVTGLDSSEAMLRICRTKLAVLPVEVGDRIKLVCGDMRAFRLGSGFGPREGTPKDGTSGSMDVLPPCLDAGFGLVFVSCNTFLHLVEEPDARMALQSARLHLAEEGVLAIHNRVPDLREMRESDGKTTVYEHYHPTRDTVLRTRVTTTRDFDRHLERDVIVVEELDGDTVVREEAAVSITTYYTVERMSALLRSSGFDVIAKYGSVEGAPLTAESAEAVFVCSKTPHGCRQA